MNRHRYPLATAMIQAVEREHARDSERTYASVTLANVAAHYVGDIDRGRELRGIPSIFGPFGGQS